MRIRKLVVFMLLSLQLWGQSTISGGKWGQATAVNQSFTIGVNSSLPTGVVQLPLQWAIKVAPPVRTGVYDVTRTLALTGTNQCTYNSTVFSGSSNGDACFAALQQSACDFWAAPDQNWLIKITHGTFIQTGVGHTCTQTGTTQYHSLTILTKIVGGGLPTGFLVFDSDTPLPSNQTVCSHGTNDATSTRQPPSGDISTWWTGTNFGCANDIGSMWTLEGNWAGSGNLGLLIQGGAWDPATNLGPSNVVFRDAEFRPTPGTAGGGGVMVQVSPDKVSTITQISQDASNWHFDNIYGHGDAVDWCNRVGGVVSYSVNNGGSGYALNDTGTINTGSGTATYKVAALTGSTVKRFTVTLAGSGYSIGNAVATTATSGVGTGLTANIYAVAAASPSCVTSFDTGGPGTNSISTALHLSDCINCSIRYSYFDYLVRQNGAEGHLIGVSRNPGPLAIVHNWLSGESINVFFGGESFTDPLYYVNNMEVRANRMTEPVSWIGTYYMGPGINTGILFKNRLEFKACQDCLVDGNYMEYSDTSGGQAGQCSEINPRQCSSTPQCDNYQVVMQNMTHTNNICRHAVSGFNIIGRSAYPGNGNGAAPPLRFANYINNLVYDIGNEIFYDHSNTVNQPFAIRIQPGSNHFICSGTKSGITITLNCTGGTTGLLQTQLAPGDFMMVEGCSDSTWNLPSANFPFTVGPTAQVGTTPTGLTVVYNNPAAVSASATNCILNNSEGNPTDVTLKHNTFVIDSTVGNFNKALIYAGIVPNILTDTGCSGAGPVFSTAITAISRTSNVVTATVASTTGWPLNITGDNQTIVEVSGVTPSDFNGKFYYLGQSGGNLTWSQVAANETGTVFGTAAQTGSCPTNMFAQRQTWKDNLSAMNTASAPACPSLGATGGQGWIAQGDGNAEGCPSGFGALGCSQNSVDPLSSTFTYNNLNGRCSTQYIEMGGANNGAQPPVTDTFPLNAVCSTGTANSNCIGMIGMMNGVPFDTSDPNYHNYGLVSSSVYKSGNTNQADDGTDMGVNFTNLDNANTSTLYVCATACGSGPFPDN